MKDSGKFGQFLARIDALSLRERTLVMLGAFMVLFLAWDTFLMSDISVRSKILGTEIAEAQQRMQQLNQAIASAARTRGSDPNVALQQELADVNKRIAALDAVLGMRASSLIPPSEMAGVIEQVLRRQGKLKLVSATSLPPRPMFETLEEKSEGATGTGTVYRHGLELEIEGRYLDVLTYLRELESLEWQFFWEVVALESKDYPSNRVLIRVYSLNLEEGWLGV